ncbi:MAG TPA: alpha/beta fold hydrolase [Hyphomicrobiaceae bacterium]|nr:alpha/beta fold hydrolase [Hyphomicrobiaceae bacterium]
MENQQFTTTDFALESGEVLPSLTLAYTTYGTRAADSRNVVLVTHGYTSSHRMVEAGGGAGSWHSLVGPGKAIDTNRLFVISSNMLGSSYGSTSPASINPRTGKPYGPDFPRITVGDIVNAQKAMLDRLGIPHLVAVAGPSYGGYQAFQWAVAYPDFVDGIVAAVTSPKDLGGPAATRRLLDQLAQDPNWNGGWYYDRGGVRTAMTAYRVNVLKFYGIEAQLAAQYPDAAAREAAIRRMAEPWVEAFDANALVVLRRALETFDTTPLFPRIRAKVLYALSRTDKLFPPTLAPDVMAKLKAAGVDARYVEIDSELGHLASGLDGPMWAPELARFMRDLVS